MNAGLIVLTFAILSGVFAYLAVNTNRENGGPLLFGNYALAYVMIFLTTYAAIDVANKTQKLSGGLLEGYGNMFPFFLGFALFYLMVNFWIHINQGDTRGERQEA